MKHSTPALHSHGMKYQTTYNAQVVFSSFILHPSRVVVKRIEIPGDKGHQVDTEKIPTGDTERHTDNCDTRPCQIPIGPLGPTMPCLPVKDTN